MTSDSQPVGVHRGAKNRERGWPGTKARRHFSDRRARAKLLIAYTATRPWAFIRSNNEKWRTDQPDRNTVSCSVACRSRLFRGCHARFSLLARIAVSITKNSSPTALNLSHLRLLPLTLPRPLCNVSWGRAINLHS